MEKTEKNLSNADCSEITNCRLCQSDQIVKILDLKKQPPANSLRDAVREQVKSFPLTLCFCDACKTAQLSETLSPKMLFSEYVWVTGTSKTAHAHSERFCESVLQRSEHAKPSVVEIASNDGTFLQAFKNNGCQILGVDPAKNICAVAKKNGIPTLTRFFSSEVADEILEMHGKQDVIIARNVIPHVKEILSIIEGLQKLTKDGGIAVIEFHHAQVIIDDLQYDSIYHEHLFYFSLIGIIGLFKKFGLYAFDMIESPISGGSVVLFLSPRKRKKSQALSSALSVEETSSLDKLETWENFGSRAKTHSIDLFNLIEQYAGTQKIIAYGASARSSTMLNFAGIKCDLIEYIIDKNPLKAGKLTPGTDIPIVDFVEGLERANNRPLLLLAWNFRDEIISELRSNGFNGKIILPLPKEITVS